MIFMMEVIVMINKNFIVGFLVGAVAGAITGYFVEKKILADKSNEYDEENDIFDDFDIETAEKNDIDVETAEDEVTTAPDFSKITYTMAPKAFSSDDISEKEKEETEEVEKCVTYWPITEEEYEQSDNPAYGFKFYESEKIPYGGKVGKAFKKLKTGESIFARSSEGDDFEIIKIADGEQK